MHGCGLDWLVRVGVDIDSEHTRVYDTSPQLDRFRLHLPQGAGEDEDRAYSQWLSFFLGFYSCLAGRHPWAAATEGRQQAGAGEDDEEGDDEDLLLLEGMRQGSSSTGLATGGGMAATQQRPMSAMYAPLDSSGGGGGGSSVGLESEGEDEDEEDDEEEEGEGTRASSLGGAGAPPDFLTDEEDASVFFPEATMTQTGTARLIPSSSSVSDGWGPAATAAASVPSTASAVSAMRMALALTLPFVEIKLLDRTAQHQQQHDDDDTAAAAAAAASAVHGWALAMHNVRVESIRGGKGLATAESHPSENVCQARFGHFELRALGADGEPLPGRPALLRPMLQDPVSPSADHAHFPKMLPRGVRDDGEDETEEGSGGGGGGSGGGAQGGAVGREEEEATAGDGASLLLRHHLRTDALAFKLHTFTYPPPPPPHVAGNLEARVARRLHVVADLPAWRGLAAFVGQHTDRRCLAGEWNGTAAQAYPLQPMPSGGVRNVALRAAGVTVRLPSTPTAGGGGGGGFTLACGAASLVQSPALPRSFLEAVEGPTALDFRLLAAVGMGAAAAPVAPPLPGTGTPVLAPWRLQLTLNDVRLLGSAAAGDDGPGDQGAELSLVDPVAVPMLVSVDDHAAAGVAPRRVTPGGEGRAFYVPLDAAAALSVSLACLGPLRVRLQPQVRIWFYPQRRSNNPLGCLLKRADHFSRPNAQIHTRPHTRHASRWPTRSSPAPASLRLTLPPPLPLLPPPAGLLGPSPAPSASLSCGSSSLLPTSPRSVSSPP
jgi:hypothetical protein